MTTRTSAITPATLAVLRKVVEHGVGVLDRSEATNFAVVLQELESNPTAVQEVVPVMKEGYGVGLRAIVEKEKALRVDKVYSVFRDLRQEFAQHNDAIKPNNIDTVLASLNDSLKETNGLISRYGLCEAGTEVYTPEDLSFLQGKNFHDVQDLLIFAEYFFDVLRIPVSTCKNTGGLNKVFQIQNVKERRAAFDSFFGRLESDPEVANEFGCSHPERRELVIKNKDSFINLADKLISLAFVN